MTCFTAFELIGVAIIGGLLIGAVILQWSLRDDVKSEKAKSKKRG